MNEYNGNPVCNIKDKYLLTLEHFTVLVILQKYNLQQTQNLMITDKYFNGHNVSETHVNQETFSLISITFKLKLISIDVSYSIFICFLSTETTPHYRFMCSDVRACTQNTKYRIKMNSNICY
jgi:hypothetical protein